MKSLNFILLFLISFAVLSAGCISPDEGRETYVVGVSSGYPPFVFTGKDGELKGIDIDSVVWIAEEEGFDIRFDLIEDWDRLIPSLLAGRIDLIYAGMTITDERAQQVTFSNPYWEVFYDVAVITDSSWTMNDFLSGKMTVSVTGGSTAEDWLDEYCREQFLSVEIIRCSSAEDAFNAVSDGKSDCCIADSSNIQYLLGESESLRHLGSVDSGMNYGVAMRNENTDLHVLINEGLEKLVSSGKLDELEQHYKSNLS